VTQALASQLEPVRHATSVAEREAVYRFRYSIYADEQHRTSALLDRQQGWLREPEDEDPSSVLLYVGTPEAVTASVRLSCWPAGGVPAATWQQLSMDRFPGLEQRPVAHVGRLMIHPEGRGRLLPSLMWAAFDGSVGRGAELIFLSCRPGLIRLYARHAGARAFGGRVLEASDGISSPLVVVPSDLEHLERTGCFLGPLWRERHGRVERPAGDPELYRRLFEGEELGVVTDPDRSWPLVEQAFVAEQSGQHFLDRLPPSLVRRLSKLGSVVDVPKGARVTRTGLAEREMFVILDGLFEAMDGERRLSLMEKGDLFGEVAFFGEAGVRSADVRALTRGRLLTIGRSFLERLGGEDSPAAISLLTALCRAMAERLARTRP